MASIFKKVIYPKCHYEAHRGIGMGKETEEKTSKEESAPASMELGKVVWGFITGMFLLFPVGMSAAYILFANKAASELYMYLGISAIVLIAVSFVFAVLAIQLSKARAQALPEKAQADK